ncbi:MAG: potassium channel family protein [Bacillus sp. (in: firmicutes)]
MKKDTVLNVFFSVLAIISLLLLLDKSGKFYWVQYVIVGLFFLFVLYDFLKAESKWNYIKAHPFELIALIPLNGIFQGAMIVRLFRLVVVFKRLKKLFPQVTGILEINGLGKVLKYTFVLIILSAIPITYFEPGIPTVTDGIWWAIVTATTVGYGDFAPVTSVGRITATILMFAGIGCIGMITGSVATYLVKSDEVDEDKEYIKKKIDVLESISNEEYELLLAVMEKKRSEQSANEAKQEETLRK